MTEIDTRRRLRDFEPVKPRPKRPEKVSQSLLARLNVCPRSGYFYMRDGGGASSHAMNRGSAFHAMAEQATKEMLENGEVEYPPQLARDLMEEILADPNMPHVPVSEHESLRSMAWNWAKGTAINPEAVVACEDMLELKLGDWIVRGKVDLAYVAGVHGEVHDYKTSMVIPSQEAFERGLQGKFYALLLLRGRFESGAKIPKGSLSGIKVAEIYPRYYIESEHKIARRETLYTAEEILQFGIEVESLLTTLDHGIKTGNFPAIPGSHCSTCPAQQDCPIEEAYRPMEIEDLDSATAVAERWDKLMAEASRLKANLKSAADANEWETIPIGSDQELTFTKVESEVVVHKDELRDLPNGDHFLEKRVSTRFGKQIRK